MLAAVPFVHPAMAAAAVAGAAVPLLIHLLNRRRYVKVPWAAMSFLLAAKRRSATRIRLEQWLVLLLRTLVVLLLGLAVARPYFPASGWVPAIASRCHHLLLLDNSLSMNARQGDGTSRWATAKAYAEGLLASLPSNDAVSLVSMAAPASAVIGSPNVDRRTVRQQLTAIEVTEQSTDIPGTVERALEILGRPESAPGNQFVYVISDFQRNLWPVDATVPTATSQALTKLGDFLENARGHLTLVWVPPAEPENVGIIGMQADATLLGVQTPIRILVEVAHFGRTTARDVTVELRRAGRVIRRDNLPSVAPRESTTATFMTAFETEGTHVLEARVLAPSEDALSADNVRFLSVEIRKERPVLLVDGRPGVTPYEGQAGYLATALAPRTATVDKAGKGIRHDPAPEDSPIQPKVITASELGSEALADYAVVALCNVARLSGEQWTQLAQFVGGGGGLLVFSGDLIDSDHYNELGYANGNGLLPCKLGRPTQPAPDSAAPTAEAPFVRLNSEALIHPIVAEFAGEPNSSLFVARVERHLAVEPDIRRAEIVLRYTNGEPAMLASSFGRGRVVLLTTSANMGWTNLPAKGDYVSLMLSTVAYLSPRRGEHRNASAGQIIFEPISAAESSMPLELAGDDGTRVAAAVVPHFEGLAVQCGPFPRTGLFALKVGGSIRSFGIHPDPAESDLESVGEPTVSAALKGRATLMSAASAKGGPRGPQTVELAQVTLILVAGLLFLELGMAMTLGRQSAAERPSTRGGLRA